MLDVLKLLGAPGSIPFLVLSILASGALIRFSRRLRRVGMVWLVGVVLSYVVLALPLVANAIVHALPAVERPSERAHTLIVLDGDNRRGRVREVQRVLATDAPSTVWVLGGRWILEALDEANVSGPAFRYDATAATTREQMAQVEAIVRDTPLTQTMVIASRLQSPRVAALIRARHISAMVVPSAIDAEPPARGAGQFVPTYIALRASRDAIYEHAALVYYRWRGWIA